jgi:hypothetical protein
MKKYINLMLLIGSSAMLSIAANAQIFTNKYKGFLGNSPVKFSLAFDPAAGTVKGFYTKSKSSKKRRVSGTCEIAKDTIEDENKILCEIQEFKLKTKKEIGRLAFLLSDEIDETWWFNGGNSTVKLTLKRYL